jgi:hypothetical protein
MTSTECMIDDAKEDNKDGGMGGMRGMAGKDYWFALYEMYFYTIGVRLHQKV